MWRKLEGCGVKRTGEWKDRVEEWVLHNHPAPVTRKVGYTCGDKNLQKHMACDVAPALYVEDPTGQDEHWVTSSKLEYVPLAHNVHDVPSRYVPLGHLTENQINMECRLDTFFQ